MAIQTLLPYDINDRAQASRAAQDLATGLEGLMQNRVQKMQQRQMQTNQAKAFSALGIPQEQADLLASADPQTQQLVLKNYLSGAESAGLEQALAGLGGHGGLGGFENAPAQNMAQVLSTLPGNQQNAITQNLLKGLPSAALQQQSMAPYEIQQQVSPESQGNGLAQVLQRPRLNPQHRLKIEEMKQRRELAEKKLNAAEQSRINKETLPTYTKINDMAHGARESDMRLNRIEQLLDKGNVQDNVFIRGLDAASHNKYLGEIFGAVKTLVSNRDTQEFEKLSKDFLRDAKQFFGNRVTQGEIFTFLQTVPSLSQTNEGKRRVIRNMKIFNEGAKLRKQAMDKIIKDNGGRRPENLEILIEDMVGPQLDALANKFKEGATGALGTLGHTAKELVTNLF